MHYYICSCATRLRESERPNGPEFSIFPQLFQTTCAIKHFR